MSAIVRGASQSKMLCTKGCHLGYSTGLAVGVVYATGLPAVGYEICMESLGVACRSSRASSEGQEKGNLVIASTLPELSQT